LVLDPLGDDIEAELMRQIDRRADHGFGGLILSGEVGLPVARSHARRSVRGFFSIARTL